jgi:hypothetical protein
MAIEGSSPFFSGNLSKKNRKDSSSSIWSDEDALEEALIDLPDPGVFNPNPKKWSNGKAIPIFTDETTIADDTSQDTTTAECTSLFSKTLDGVDTPATEMDSQDQSEKPEQDLLESKMESQLSKHLLKKFAYAPRDSGVTGLDFPPDLGAQQNETAEPKQEEEDELPEIEDSAWHLADKTEIVVPASDGIEPEIRLPLPALHTTKDTAPSSSIGAVKGSEDFLVPESSEAEVSSPERSSRGKRKRFDFGRFTYTPC